MNKYIISCIRFGQKCYVCHNNFSGSYSAGVLEFDTKEDAWAEAAKRKLEFVTILPVTK